MAHLTLRSAYPQLVDRLNRSPLGAPPSHLLHRILGMLFTEKEAGLAARLPLRPFTAREAARVWKLDELTARLELERLCDRLLLLDMRREHETWYVLPPPMAGFFEFALMRVRADVDQALLSELLYEYVNRENDFAWALFVDGETKLGKALVNEEAIPVNADVETLDHERATEIIRKATHIGIGLCYCRHKMRRLDRACTAPLEICMVLNMAAGSLIRHGAARRVDAEEALDLLQRGKDLNLVQLGENVREGVNFICNCCSCCCDPLHAMRRFGLVHTLSTTNFIAAIDASACKGCGVCSSSCPSAAVRISANHRERREARLDEKLCLGCGICVRRCGSGAARLAPRPRRVITPRDSFHRTVLMAAERGTLQNLIFDNQVLGSQRAMAAIVGVILRLPPVKRSLVHTQLGSRFLEKLADRVASGLR